MESRVPVLLDTDGIEGSQIAANISFERVVLKPITNYFKTLSVKVLAWKDF